MLGCVVFFFPVSPLRWNSVKLPFLTMTRPLLTFLSAQREKYSLAHAAQFKTWDLLPPSPLCSLVNKPLCFIALSWIFRPLCRWFSSCLCCTISFFSLFDSWFWVDPSHQVYQNVHIHHSPFISNTFWHLKIYMESFLLYLLFKSFF